MKNSENNTPEASAEDGIGQKIRFFRNLRGYSQDYMARKIGIIQQEYSRMENGTDADVSWQDIKDIARVLDVHPAAILSFEKAQIFSNCTQSGNFNRYDNAATPVAEQTIAFLLDEIRRLRQRLGEE